MTTKQQEREALEKIRNIVADLGQDSYIGSAFEGCFEIAEENIDNDFACSMKQRAEKAERDVQHFQDMANFSSNRLEKALREIGRLKKQLEAEQEWRDYEMKENVQQCDYEKLVKQSDTRYLTDEEAKVILYNWYGFAKEKIIIHKFVSTYQINRHRQIRNTGMVDRRPAYNATDWNYIRFDCGGMSYELYNDTLSFFIY